MSDVSTIEWTDATWNPVTGCTKVSPGCAHCYIERTPPFRIAGRRFEMVDSESTTGVRLHPERIGQPLRWRKPRRVFVCSLADLFHDHVPFEFIHDVLDTVSRVDQHTFQVLTKGPDRAREFFAALPLGEHGPLGFMSRLTIRSRELGVAGALPNMWLGVSIENARYTWRADVLREIPAAVRFISAEPLLGSLFPPTRETTIRTATTARRGAEIANARTPLDLTGIDWIIIGGESGGKSRPFRLDHARELVEQVYSHRAHEYRGYGPPAIFVKQLGARPLGAALVEGDPLALTGDRTPLKLRDRKGGDWDEWPADLRIREFPRPSWSPRELP